MLLKMKDNVLLIIILTVASAVVYGLQFTIFHRGDETLFYLLQDLVFVPVQVLIVTLIINRFLNLMERRKKMKKVNVIISTFFSDAGTALMTEIACFNRQNDAMCEYLCINDLEKSGQGEQAKAVNGIILMIFTRSRPCSTG